MTAAPTTSSWGPVPRQLPWSWQAWAAWGRGSELVIQTSAFPSCATSQMPGASSAQTQQCFWFGPTEALGGSWAMAWYCELEAYLPQFLGKINLLFILLCTHSFPGCSRFTLPIYQFLIPPVEHTYRSAKVQRSLGGFQSNTCAFGIPWACAQLNFRTWPFVCCRKRAYSKRPTSVTLNLKKNKAGVIAKSLRKRKTWNHRSLDPLKGEILSRIQILKSLLYHY